MSIICRLVWFGSFLLCFFALFWFGLFWFGFSLVWCFALFWFGLFWFGFSLVWCFALLCFGLVCFGLVLFCFGFLLCFVKTYHPSFLLLFTCLLYVDWFGLVLFCFGFLLCFGLVCFGLVLFCFGFLLCFGLVWFVLVWFFFGLVFCFALFWFGLFCFGFSLVWCFALFWFVLLKLTCDEWGGAESRGSGARPVEFNDNERHLRHSPVSSPTEELRKDKRRSDDSARRERSRPGPPASLRSHGSRPCPTRHITILHFCYFHMSIICNYIVLHLSQTQTFNPNNEISS